MFESDKSVKTSSAKADNSDKLYEQIKVAEKQKIKTVMVISKLTITPDKIFYLECIEKAGGRHLNIEMTADDFNLVRAL